MRSSCANKNNKRMHSQWNPPSCHHHPSGFNFDNGKMGWWPTHAVNVCKPYVLHEKQLWRSSITCVTITMATAHTLCWWHQLTLLSTEELSSTCPAGAWTGAFYCFICRPDVTEYQRDFPAFTMLAKTSPRWFLLTALHVNRCWAFRAAYEQKLMSHLTQYVDHQNK